MQIGRPNLVLHISVFFLSQRLLDFVLPRSVRRAWLRRIFRRSACAVVREASSAVFAASSRFAVVFRHTFSRFFPFIGLFSPRNTLSLFIVIVTRLLGSQKDAKKEKSYD